MSPRHASSSLRRLVRATCLTIVAVLLGGLLASAPASAQNVICTPLPSGPGAPVPAREVAFVVDGSGSVSDADWAIEKAALLGLLYDETLFPRDESIAVSVFQYSTTSGEAGPREAVVRTEACPTLIANEFDVQILQQRIGRMFQIGFGTTGGAAILEASNVLLANGHPSAEERRLCLLTDGVANLGPTALEAALDVEAFGIDRLAIAALEDPGRLDQAGAEAAFGGAVFGGGNLTYARSSAEFVGLFGAACMAEPVRLHALEVTQVVQDWQDSIPLVEDKATYVRAFLEPFDCSTGSEVVNTTARLSASRGGVPLGSKVLPINAALSAALDCTPTNDREDPTSSLNFRLPDEWTNGFVELELELPGGIDCGDGSLQNECTKSVAFDTTDFPALTYLSVPSKRAIDVAKPDEIRPTRTPSLADLVEQEARGQALLPYGDLNATFEFFDGLPAEGTLGRFVEDPDNPPAMLFVTQRRDEAVVAPIKWYFWRTRCTVSDGCPTDRIHGLVNRQAGVTGISNPSGARVSTSNLGEAVAPLAMGHHRNTAVHELVHNFQVTHTGNTDLFGTESFPYAYVLRGEATLGPCGSWTDPNKDPLFPHIIQDPASSSQPRATLGPLTLPPGTRDPATEIWGVASNIPDWETNANLAIANPATDWALMSYCRLPKPYSTQKWISSTNYLNVYDLLRTVDFDEPIEGGRTEAVLEFVFAGSIDEVNAVTELDPIFTVTAPGPYDAAPGPYTAALLDATGAELASVAFSTTVFEPYRPELPDPDGPYEIPPQFFVTIDAPSAPVAAAVIRQGATELARIDASAEAPAVSIVSPAPGSTQSGETVAFEWTASDPDDDALHYAIDYSHDDGTTWWPLSVGRSEPTLRVDREWLRAGNNARFRVTATDGLRSTTVTSEPFVVVNNAPTVVVQHPGDEQAFTSAQRIRLDATVYDREEGRLDGTSVTWLSSRNGTLGTGAVLDIGAEELAEGEHLIVARAVDAEGAVGGDSTTIHISRVPQTLRAVPDFALRMDPPARTINPGGDTTFIVYLTALNGFSDPVALSVVDLPDGWSASFDPPNVTPDGFSELTISAPATATETDIPIIVRGTSGDIERTTTLTAGVVFGLIPQCYGQIAGIASDALTGEPIEGATLSPSALATTSDETGYFNTGDVVPRSWPSVRVRATGYYDRVYPTVDVYCDDVTNLDAELVPALTATAIGRVVEGEVDPDDTSAGRAVTPTDTPVGSASVSVGGGFTRSNSDGTYLLTGVPLEYGTNAPRSWRFTASQTGFWSQERTAIVSLETPLILDFALVEVCDFELAGSGRVVDLAGLPVAGATIRWGSDFDAGSATSGADGTFEMPPGTARPGYNNSAIEVGLLAEPPPTSPSGTLTRVDRTITADQCGPNRLDGYVVTIEEFLPPPVFEVRLTGTVRDAETLDPIPNARLRIFPTGSSAQYPRADVNGFYDVTVRIGSNTETEIEILGDRTPLHWDTSLPAFLAQAGETYQNDLFLPPIEFLTIEGIVRDRETRLPVEGLEVRVGGSGAPRDVTDASGFYRLEEVEPGRFNEPRFVGVSTDTRVDTPSGLVRYYSESETRFAEAGQSLIQNFDPLRQCDGGAISGVVVNAETLEPLEDARVSISGIANELTDVDGRFRLENIPPRDGNTPRQVTVRASRSGFISASKVVTVFCGSEIFLEFGAPAGGFGEIFGTVTDEATGDPIEGVAIGSGYGDATTTDALGDYRLLNAPLAADGSDRVWRVNARRGQDAQSADVTVSATAPVRQDFVFASDPAFGIDVVDERSFFDPATRTIRSEASLVVTNTTGATITGPLAATILIDKAGVDMPFADGVDDIGNPVFFVVDGGVELALDDSVRVDLEFSRTAPTAFLFDVQLALGDPTVEALPQRATAPLRPLAVLPQTSDADGDRWHDRLDVCPTRPDPEQLDLDGDGVGDACADLTADPTGSSGDESMEPDRIPPTSSPRWLRIRGTAPDGAITVSLNGVRAAVAESGRFEIVSPVGTEPAPIELVFEDDVGQRSTRLVDVRIVRDQEEARP